MTATELFKFTMMVVIGCFKFTGTALVVFFRLIGKVWKILFTPISLGGIGSFMTASIESGGRCSSTETEVCNYRLRDITDSDYREVYAKYADGDATAAVILNMLKRIRELEAKK